MAVLTIQPLASGINETVSTSVSGLTSQPATPLFINTNDTVATVTTTGYLNASKALFGNQFINGQMAQVFTTDSGADWYKVSISGDNISLVASEGSVTPPITNGDFAVFNGTSGGLKDAGYHPSDPTLTRVVMSVAGPLVNRIAKFMDTQGTIGPNGSATGGVAINPGDIQAGLKDFQSFSPVAGGFISSPPGLNKGSFKFQAGNNADGIVVTVINESHAQNTSHFIPDPGVANAKFILDNNASTQHILTGSLEVDTGSLIAGSDANAGELVSYPATTASGTFIVGASDSAGAFNAVLTNNSLGQTTTFRLPDPGAASAGILVSTLTAPDNNANLVRFDVTVGFAALATGGTVTLLASSGAKQYKIINLWVNAGGTNFSGGGGDRLLDITDGTTVYSTIPAASLQTLANTAWGVTELPFPAAAAINTSTAAGASLICEYSGGASDYTAGSVVISGLLQRVA